LSRDKAATVAFLVGWLAFRADIWGNAMIFKAECANELGWMVWALELEITSVLGVRSVVAKE